MMNLSSRYREDCAVLFETDNAANVISVFFFIGLSQISSLFSSIYMLRRVNARVLNIRMLSVNIQLTLLLAFHMENNLHVYI